MKTPFTKPAGQAKPERIAGNADVFDFELTADEVTAIHALGRRGR